MYKIALSTRKHKPTVRKKISKKYTKLGKDLHESRNIHSVGKMTHNNNGNR
jgi:hypothetical protein